MSSNEPPAGMETKSNQPGYVTTGGYTPDVVAQGGTPGISNTPGADSWDGQEASAKDEKSDEGDDGKAASTRASSRKTGSTEK